MGCLPKLFYLVITCLVAYQAIYNLRGAMELGGNYMSWRSLLYSVVSLVPAIALGIHACRMVFAKKAEKQQALAESTVHRWISRIYMALAVLMVLARVIIHFVCIH